MTSAEDPSSSRLDPKIRYYIIRQHSNAIVPLLPADQLPFHLKDFPKNLNHKQLSEGNWKYLEETGKFPFPLILADDHAAPGVTQASRTAETMPFGRRETKRVGVENVVPTQLEQSYPTASVRRNSILPNIQSMSTATSLIYAADAQNFGNTPSRPVSQAGAPSVQSQPYTYRQPEYCRYWLRSGNCYFGDACRYRHEMPSARKLAELGYVDVPGWYRKRDMIAQMGALRAAGRQQVGSRSVVELSDDDDDEDAEHGYRTNAANEPMLMDWGDAKGRAHGFGRSARSSVGSVDSGTRPGTPDTQCSGETLRTTYTSMTATARPGVLKKRTMRGHRKAAPSVAFEQVQEELEKPGLTRTLTSKQRKNAAYWKRKKASSTRGIGV